MAPAQDERTAIGGALQRLARRMENAGNKEERERELFLSLAHPRFGARIAYACTYVAIALVASLFRSFEAEQVLAAFAYCAAVGLLVLCWRAAESVEI